ncbi:hypothetical protein PHOSAC3_120995 [Mesotoga infera]|nr:hypothetical protein PHOSAC3_120995 [Mesotoga infera]
MEKMENDFDLFSSRSKDLSTGIAIRIVSKTFYLFVSYLVFPSVWILLLRNF